MVEQYSTLSWRNGLPVSGVLLTLLSLVGCSLGPEYVRPQNHATSESAFLSDLSGRDAAEVAAPAESSWWLRFNDPLLNAWISRLHSENLDLRVSLERIEQSRQQVRIQSGARWPALGISGDGGRRFAPDALANGERDYRSEVNLASGISWQLDLFGRIRQGIKAAHYQASAREQDYIGLRQSLIAELVGHRARLALLEKEIEIQQTIVSSREQTLNTVNRRYRLGVKNASAVDVHTARENLSTAQATFNALKLALDETYLAVDRLLNQAPGGERLSSVGFPLLPPMPVPVLISPAQLLDQRPDILGSELRLKAANAGIGVAVADLFPDLTLTASGGFVGSQIGGLLVNDQAVGSIITQLNTRLFEGGRLRAQIRLREAEARELAWQYANVVLTAMIEVETALVQERSLRAQVDNLLASVASARRAEALSRERYQRGITSLLELLETQRRWQNAERNLLAAQQASWNARINLHLALGGDWQLGQPVPPQSRSRGKEK
ncbi:MAG TPA: hypothetical protein DCF62_07810 [Porticoccaceae bacterium]|nr:hypothetical protein [Porticoccaceae bacterium]HCO61592.1 hypothetical protein [Porticoccaceae bacterium]